MAGPAPRDNYNPTQSVEPQTNAPNDYLNVRATPQDFGAQVGQATEGLGKTTEAVGTEAGNAGVAYQGMLNEHAVNQAELAFATDGGEVYNKYKSMSGLDAANARPQAIQDYLAVYQKNYDSLGNRAAQRAFAQVASRRISFTVQDMNGYAAEQTQKAFRTGNQASQALAIDTASRYSVATDPKQFGTLSTGPVIFTTNTDFTAPGWGKYQTLPVNTDKTTGRLQFDTSTDQGKVAQADYDNTLNVALGKAYSNAAVSIAIDPDHGNYTNAMNFVLQNKDKMPSATFNELSQKLDPMYRSEQVRQAVDNRLGMAHTAYLNQQIGPNTPDTLTNVFLSQESGNGATSTNLGQIQPGTWERFAKPGEDINNPNDNRAVTQRILSKYNSDYQGDVSRMAVAYFSGPGNVAPPGSATPWIQDRTDKTGKSVSSYVSDINSKSGSVGNPVDYFGMHESELASQVRQDLKDHGFDITVQDQGAERTLRQVAEMRSYQQAESRALGDNFTTMVMDEKHPITSEAALDYNQDPKVRADWMQYKQLNPWGASGIVARVNSQARGLSKTFGTDFYDKGLLPVLEGNAKPDDLQNYFGGDQAPISASGIRQLDKVYQDMQTPQGQAFAKSEAQFLERAKGVITGSSILPGVNPAARMKEYNAWLGTALNQIAAAKTDGKGSEIFDSNNKTDYVGKSILAPTEAQLTSIMSQSMLTQMGDKNTQSQSPAKPVSFNSREDVGKAYQTGQLTREQAKAYLSTHFPSNVPTVPFKP